MSDAILDSFLLAQERDGLQLARESDILSIEPLGPSPNERYVVRFDARSVLADRGRPREARGVFVIGVWFPSDYLCRVTAPQVLTWVGPAHIFHPNVSGPFICLGPLRPATPLVELCFRVFAVISYQNYGLTSPLNPAAAAWARRNLARFPVDPRPLKRQVAVFRTRVFERGGAA